MVPFAETKPSANEEPARFLVHRNEDFRRALPLQRRLLPLTTSMENNEKTVLRITPVPTPHMRRREQMRKKKIAHIFSLSRHVRCSDIGTACPVSATLKGEKEKTRIHSFFSLVEGSDCKLL